MTSDGQNLIDVYPVDKDIGESLGLFWGRYLLQKQERFLGTAQPAISACPHVFIFRVLVARADLSWVCLKLFLSRAFPSTSNTPLAR